MPREGFNTNETMLISSSPRLQNMSVFLRIQVRTNSQTKAENGEQDWGEIFFLSPHSSYCRVRLSRCSYTSLN